jgi:cytochrome bd ubiquinol oxidase subunit II
MFDPSHVVVYFWTITVLAIGLYVTLDGYDLGVGILFPFAPSDADRDAMMASIGPVWDGNETWLVLGGMTLLVGMPIAFSILLPAFYMPLVLMLFGLVLRGVSLEFRGQRGPLQIAWSIAFSGGSILAAFCQGTILGRYIEGGVAVVDNRFAGGPLDWLGVFPVLTGLGVIAAYALLGACWLIWKTEGNTQTFAREVASLALLGSAAALLVVSGWTAFVLPAVAERWFAWPNALLLAPLPLAAIVIWIALWRTRWGRHEGLPFALAVGLLLVSLIGLLVSIWPAAIPGALSLWDEPPGTHRQSIIAVIVAVILPIVLAYTVYSHWVFRGKAKHAYEDGEAEAAPAIKPQPSLDHAE